MDTIVEGNGKYNTLNAERNLLEYRERRKMLETYLKMQEERNVRCNV